MGRHSKHGGVRGIQSRHRLIGAVAAAILAAAIVIPVALASTVTVQSGDTLYGLAQKYLGNGNLWPELYAANRQVVGDNPNLILVGEQLQLAVSTSHAIAQPPSGPIAQQGSITADVYAVFGSGASCALQILHHESGTSPADVTISNPNGGAYGLPQALPGYKMASAGADWATNPVTQLRWMKQYTIDTYGSICNAAYHDVTTGTY